VRLWVDDLRPPPEGDWVWVKTVEQAAPYLERDEVREASLDNDLGEDVHEGRKLVLWMAEHEKWPTERVAIHSANPVALEYMVGMIERYGPYRKVLGRPEFWRSASDF
jgi:hypothetical protein